MVTASGTKANLVKAYTRGCDGFLVKPVKRDVLEEKLLGLELTKIEKLPTDTYDES
jgi:CheY-like chemotaxis protein